MLVICSYAVHSYNTDRDPTIEELFRLKLLKDQFAHTEDKYTKRDTYCSICKIHEQDM